MKDYRLEGMVQNAISFDLETHIVQPGLLAPPIVLGSAAEVGPDGRLIGSILTKEQCREVFLAILRNPQVVVCVANGAYDFLVEAVDFAKRGIDIMPEIFAMYDPERTIVRGDCDGRVFETQLAEPLHAIAQGHLGKDALSGEKIGYSLKDCTMQVLGRDDAKANDQFRLKYAQFDDWPLEKLPFEAVQYPIDDAKNTIEVALAQAGHGPSVNHHEWGVLGSTHQTVCRHCRLEMTPETPQACMVRRRRRNMHDLSKQAYFAWAAHLGAAWGFNVPQDAVDALEKKIDDAREAAIKPFLAAEILRENGTENQSVLKRMVAVAYGARDLCGNCNGTGKIPSPATNGKTKINCPDCDGCALRLTPEVPRSEGGGIGKARDVLLESGDELLMEYGEQPSKKIKTTYIPMLRGGRACNVCGLTGAKTKYKPAHEDWCTTPNGEAGYRPIPVNVRLNPLVETGRSAIRGGWHGIPRHGGIRECIVAPGPQYEEIEVPDDYVLLQGEEIVK